jgi:hypothetical protein
METLGYVLFFISIIGLPIAVYVVDKYGNQRMSLKR